MKKAGKALRRVLSTYGITQNKLAVTMGIGRSTIHHWVNESRDPAADAVLEIRKALHEIDPAAAEEFTRLYLGELSQDQITS